MLEEGSGFGTEVDQVRETVKREVARVGLVVLVLRLVFLTDGGSTTTNLAAEASVLLAVVRVRDERSVDDLEDGVV